MDKNKGKYSSYNTALIRRLQQKYGTTPHYIYASLRGDRNSETSQRIVEDYKKAEEQINKILDQI